MNNDYNFISLLDTSNKEILNDFLKVEAVLQKAIKDFSKETLEIILPSNIAILRLASDICISKNIDNCILKSLNAYQYTIELYLSILTKDNPNHTAIIKSNSVNIFLPIFLEPKITNLNLMIDNAQCLKLPEYTVFMHNTFIKAIIKFSRDNGLLPQILLQIECRTAIPSMR